MSARRGAYGRHMNPRLALHLARTHQADLHQTAAARRSGPPSRRARPAARGGSLCAMFAAQAGLLSLGPLLPDVAREFGVSVAAGGQVRTLGGLAGGAAAVAVALLGSRLGLRGMLTAGYLTLALGTAARTSPYWPRRRRPWAPPPAC